MNKRWLSTTALIPIALVARAEVYLSADQAIHLIFPNSVFTKQNITLTPEQVASIEKASGDSVHSKKLTAYVSKDKNSVFIDQVLGKHELITIAVGIKPDGTVQGLEILEYKETYGYQVRNADWRKQFLGKGPGSELKLGSDIKNISGATLSSAHITAGVRRLVHTYEVVRATL